MSEIQHGDPAGTYAQVIADTISEDGHRVTTLEVQCHRFVLAEFNTHRAFSRNSASSRAIPVAKQLAQVRQNPAVPISFPAEQRGMQGGAELSAGDRRYAENLWRGAASYATSVAEELASIGVHKSVANRLLEPFMWHRIIVTSTEWENFFSQRCSPLAQPEIRLVAEHMRDALQASTPGLAAAGAWHLPYVDDDTYDVLADRDGVELEDALRVSAARCARVSYLTHDGKRDVDADLALYERLVMAVPPHWSPLEHVARPLASGERALGNLAGWQQLRHLDLGEER